VEKPHSSYIFRRPHASLHSAQHHLAENSAIQHQETIGGSASIDVVRQLNKEFGDYNYANSDGKGRYCMWLDVNGYTNINVCIDITD
jgi:hypothetical protein